MTIAALHHLLNEIDSEGGPDAARRNHLHLTSEGPHTMATATAPLATLRQPSTAEPEQLPVGKLLAWGDQHTDPDIQDQAARARAALTGLRQRYAADRELTALTAEREQLEKRLAELQTREAELTPTKTKTKRKRDYDTREVRTWAADNGIDCPRVGQIPKRVLDAWRTATQQTRA